jgi:hypothetical protein
VIIRPAPPNAAHAAEAAKRFSQGSMSAVRGPADARRWALDIEAKQLLLQSDKPENTGILTEIL